MKKNFLKKIVLTSILGSSLLFVQCTGQKDDNSTLDRDRKDLQQNEEYPGETGNLRNRTESGDLREGAQGEPEMNRTVKEEKDQLVANLKAQKNKIELKIDELDKKISDKSDKATAESKQKMEDSKKQLEEWRDDIDDQMDEVQSSTDSNFEKVKKDVDKAASDIEVKFQKMSKDVESWFSDK